MKSFTAVGSKTRVLSYARNFLKFHIFDKMFHTNSNHQFSVVTGQLADWTTRGLADAAKKEN